VNSSIAKRRPLAQGLSKAKRNHGYKRTLAAFLAGSLLLTFLISITTYIIDPLQQYRKAAWYKPTFSQEQRYQNPGLAKNYDYDTIILGTSMTENFSPSQVGKALGGKTLKLSIQGSTAGEQYQIAKLALDTGKVKTVLWGLDYFALKSGVPEDQGPFPFYLYDNKLWNDYKYWFNITTYQLLWKSLTKRLTGAAPQDLEHLYNWQRGSSFSEFLVVKDYKKAQVEEAYFGLNEDPLSSIKNSFNTYILSLVKAHPEVDFRFYYPPYSILRQVVWQKTNKVRYENQIEMKTWMFDQFHKNPNVKVYDFQTEADWTFNLSLYKDLSHHTEDLNKAIAEAIGRNDAKYLLTKQNVESFNTDLRRQVASAIVDRQNHLQRFTVWKGRIGNGDPVEFSLAAAPGDGELLVPVKEALPLLGATLGWDQATKTLTLERNSRKLQMEIGGRQATVDGRSEPLADPAEIFKGSTLIPLHDAADKLGVKVHVEAPSERVHNIVIGAS
jgi:hypothetical protein